MQSFYWDLRFVRYANRVLICYVLFCVLRCCVAQDRAGRAGNFGGRAPRRTAPRTDT